METVYCRTYFRKCKFRVSTLPKRLSPDVLKICYYVTVNIPLSAALLF